MKATKILKIPMFPTSYYDKEQGVHIQNGTLSHANYVGETHYVGPGKRLDPTYIDNIPWDDELTYDDFYRGRSAAGAIFKNAAGQIFTVFMKDLGIFIPHMVNGKIKGKFIYCKRGMNYGVTLYG
jgi:hypothetical protein